MEHSGPHVAIMSHYVGVRLDRQEDLLVGWLDAVTPQCSAGEVPVTRKGHLVERWSDPIGRVRGGAASTGERRTINNTPATG